MLNRKLVASASLSALLALGAALPAQAAPVVDQQNSSGGAFTSVTGSAPSLGQSFTPSFGFIDFARFDLFASDPTTYRVDLYAGASGYAGGVLGSSNALPLPVGTIGAQQTVEFDFASPIALTAGSPYSLKLVMVTGPAGNSTLGASMSNGDAYAGGTRLLGSTGFAVSNDLVFSEGFNTPSATVPEPSTLLLTGLALAGVVVPMRRKKKAVSAAA